MAKDLEEFKMIIDLAKNGGMMEARIAMMEDQQKQKDEEIAKLREMLPLALPAARNANPCLSGVSARDV